MFKFNIKKASRPRETENPKRRKVKRIVPDPDIGLTNEQAGYYADSGWDNRAVEVTFKTTGEILKKNIITYFNFIFIIFAVLLILVGSFRDLSFMLVIVLNSAIGIVQELNAKKTLEKLTVLNAPRTKVLRGGVIKSLPSDRLVINDIVIFESGNQICADSVLIDGEVLVNEALLTGESDEILKKPGDPLMSGSFIVSGRCKARLERVGEDSYISKLTLEAKATKDAEQSEMVRSINRLIKVIGIIIIPIGITLFVQQYVYGNAPLKDSVQSMVSAVIGMIPEGMYLLLSITLAVSTIKLATKKVLVHDMRCIETLARVNVLCVDKTGTITENDMKVTETVQLEEISESGYADTEMLLSNFAAAMSDDNLTMKAIKARFSSASGMKRGQVVPFSSKHKYSSVVLDDVSYVLGAPEFVLREKYEDYSTMIANYSSEGARVLVFCKYDGTADGNALTGNTTPICLILLSNPVRKNAKKTFEYFRSQGVDIKVISGDNPLTVSKVAEEAGISNADEYVDASQLKNYDEIYTAVNKYSVFGRVSPEQKRMFIRALKQAGNTVAMTGDGVNDVLALKDADCSVAMATGSDAAVQASQLVLLESDFSRMPDVVLEGRQVVNNLERSGSLFLVKNIFSFLMAIFSIAFSLSYPIEPAQLTLISLFTIGFPAFLLSQVPNTRRIEGRFISNILIKALPGGLTDALIVCALVIFGIVFNVNSLDISTAATFLLSIVGFIIVYQISKPMDVFKWIIWLVSILGLLLGATVFSRMFAITGMSMRCIMIFVVFSILTEPLYRYLSMLTQFLRKQYRLIRTKFFRKKAK